MCCIYDQAWGDGEAKRCGGTVSSFSLTSFCPPLTYDPGHTKPLLQQYQDVFDLGFT